MLANLDQQGGAAITVQTTNGVTFDSIVYAERDARQWMAGSDGFRRWQCLRGPRENQAKDQIVHIAITYQSGGTITAYRNGQPYGRAYQTGFAKFPAGKSQVLFGLRHGTSAGGNRMLAAQIERAELFDRALTAEEVAASAGAPIVTEAEILAQLTENERSQRSELRKKIVGLQAKSNRITVSKVYCVPKRRAGRSRTQARQPLPTWGRSSARRSAVGERAVQRFRSRPIGQRSGAAEEIGSLDHKRTEPAVRPHHRQPPVASSFWHRTDRNAERSRFHRGCANTPRRAGYAGFRSCQRRLESETTPSHDPAFGHVSSVFEVSP